MGPILELQRQWTSLGISEEIIHTYIRVYTHTHTHIHTRVRTLSLTHTHACTHAPTAHIRMIQVFGNSCGEWSLSHYVSSYRIVLSTMDDNSKKLNTPIRKKHLKLCWIYVWCLLLPVIHCFVYWRGSSSSCCIAILSEKSRRSAVGTVWL